MGFSSGSSKSEPKDMTPQEFRNLRSPLADVVAGLLGYSAQPQGPAGTSAPATTNTGFAVGAQGNQGLAQPQFAGRPNDPVHPNGLTPGQSAMPLWFNQQGQGMGAGGATVNPNYTPTGDPNDPLRGIPSYGGDLSAPLGANEQSLLDQLMGMGNVDDIRALLNSIAGGGNTNSVGYNPQDLGQFAQGFQDARQVGNYDPNSENPFLQAAIEAAQRPTLQGLEETLSRTLPGRFTQAGQFVQPQGSSAFDRAAAIATRGASDTLGDIATNLSYQTTADQLNRAFQAQQATQSQESEALQAELARQGAYGESARQREFEGGQAEQDRQLEATQQLAQLSSQEVQDTINNLQAQALPRLIEEFGIERGIQEFNNRMNSLLVLLQTAGGVSTPVVANESKSSQSGLQLK